MTSGDAGSCSCLGGRVARLRLGHELEGIARPARGDVSEANREGDIREAIPGGEPPERSRPGSSDSAEPEPDL